MRVGRGLWWVFFLFFVDSFSALKFGFDFVVLGCMLGCYGN